MITANQEGQTIMETLRRIERRLGELEGLNTGGKGRDDNWLTEAEAMALTGKSRETLKMYRNGRRKGGELVYPPILHKWRAINGRSFQYWRPELEKIFS